MPVGNGNHSYYSVLSGTYGTCHYGSQISYIKDYEIYFKFILNLNLYLNLGNLRTIRFIQ